MFGKMLKSMGRKSALYNIKCEIQKMNVSFPHAPDHICTNIKAFMNFCLVALSMDVGIQRADIEEVINESVGSSARRQLSEILSLLARMSESAHKNDIASVNYYEPMVHQLFKESTGGELRL
jgi:hypothetical protein